MDVIFEKYSKYNNNINFFYFKFLNIENNNDIGLEYVVPISIWEGN